MLLFVRRPKIWLVKCFDGTDLNSARQSVWQVSRSSKSEPTIPKMTTTTHNSITQNPNWVNQHLPRQTDTARCIVWLTDGVPSGNTSHASPIAFWTRQVNAFHICEFFNFNLYVLLLELRDLSFECGEEGIWCLVVNLSRKAENANISHKQINEPRAQHLVSVMRSFAKWTQMWCGFVI